MRRIGVDLALTSLGSGGLEQMPGSKVVRLTPLDLERSLTRPYLRAFAADPWAQLALDALGPARTVTA